MRGSKGALGNSRSSFGRTETRMLREAYQKTADSVDALQVRLSKIEQAVLDIHCLLARVVERQDELYDVVQDLAVLTATHDKEDSSHVPATPAAKPPPSRPVVTKSEQPFSPKQCMDDVATAPPTPACALPPTDSPPCLSSFQSEWLEE